MTRRKLLLAGAAAVSAGALIRLGSGGAAPAPVYQQEPAPSGSAPAEGAVSTGPVVRVARGNNVTIVPVGAK